MINYNKDKLSLTPIQAIRNSLHEGWRGGSSGALAMSINVCSLMWTRTIINYQYRYGLTTSQAAKNLWSQGQVRRFYRGIGPALIHAPLCRFGGTASNTFIMSLLEPYDIPLTAKTGTSAILAGLWRMLLAPIDTIKTTLQVEGKQALPLLGAKIGTHGVLVTFHGALAAASATALGHFPWFFTLNTLQDAIPKPIEGSNPLWMLSRNALIGFSASIVSDTISNSLRVIKTTRQTFAKPLSYAEVVRHVIKADGVIGLFGRGLKTRILGNALNSMLFNVLWKYIMELQEKTKKDSW